MAYEERVKQTSKTMIIEEFCASDNVPDLCTMLMEEDVKMIGSFNRSVKEKLEVSDFEQFVEKFMPSVWEWQEKSEDMEYQIRFCYSLEKPVGQPQAHELKLSEQEFYKMIMDLYSKKSVSGESNLEFDYNRVAELLSPAATLENAKQLRKALQYNFNKLEELPDSAKRERAICQRKIVDVRKKIVRQYKDSFTGIVKLALADTESRLAALPQKEENAPGNTETFRLPCKVQFDENGDLDVIPIEANGIEVEEPSGDGSENKIARLVAQDYDQYGQEQSSYIKNLVVANYSGGELVEVPDREALVRKRDQYVALYRNAQERFIRAISSAVERILDMKVFFEQASIDGKKLQAPVIITNCKASKLIDGEVKGKFEFLVREWGRATDRVWFAVIPAVGENIFQDVPDNDIEYDSDLNFAEEDVSHDIKKQDGEVLVGLQTVKLMLDILKKGKITTFFNFRANEFTGFGQFTSEILTDYREKLESIEGNEYAVFTYPNFSILPRKDTVIRVGKTTNSEREEEEVYLDIPGIYVESAYVAAGLVVASQSRDYLKSKKYEVKPGYPCVRFDLEEGENPFIMLTRMNCEGEDKWLSEVEENIDKDRFGFSFCGNTKFYNGGKVKNSYVYTVRSMAKDKDGNYKPLYKTLTKDFIIQYLQGDPRVKGSSAKADVINSFVSGEVSEWERDAESNNYANNILKKNETIRRSPEDGRLKVEFGHETEEIPLTVEED